MTRDRSLDDFVGGGESEEREDDERGNGASDDGNDGDGSVADPDAVAKSERTPPTTEDVDPAVGTYRWHPDGVACATCGETVHRLWLDDGEQVCDDCKEW